MLLFKKKDLLIVISKSDNTVQFTKHLKDILKYQHRYNYKFKMYENGKVTVADDYIIDGETLTVLFGGASVTYNAEGASYNDGGGGSGGSSDDIIILKIDVDDDTGIYVLNAKGWTVDDYNAALKGCLYKPVLLCGSAVSAETEFDSYVVSCVGCHNDGYNASTGDLSLTFIGQYYTRLVDTAKLCSFYTIADKNGNISYDNLTT